MKTSLSLSFSTLLINIKPQAKEDTLSAKSAIKGSGVTLLPFYSLAQNILGINLIIRPEGPRSRSYQLCTPLNSSIASDNFLQMPRGSVRLASHAMEVSDSSFWGEANGDTW